MKVLLDENLPYALRRLLPGHDVFTVGYLGWKGLENGDLLAAAAANGFDVLVSKDAGIEFEQDPGGLQVAVILLRAKSNAIEVIEPLVPALLKALTTLKPRTLLVIAADS